MLNTIDHQGLEPFEVIELAILSACEKYPNLDIEDIEVVKINIQQREYKIRVTRGVRREAIEMTFYAPDSKRALLDFIRQEWDEDCSIGKISRIHIQEKG